MGYQKFLCRFTIYCRLRATAFYVVFLELDLIHKIEPVVETRAGGRLLRISVFGFTSVKHPVVISEGVVRKSEVH